MSSLFVRNKGKFLCFKDLTGFFGGHFFLQTPTYEVTPEMNKFSELIFVSFILKRFHFSVYVDISDPEEECTTLAFDFQDKEITRQWNITIIQISCDYENRAPPGCLQYHFNVNEAGVGRIIKSFNFDGGYHLGAFHVYPVRESLLKF